jgi:hypothetical protein
MAARLSSHRRWFLRDVPRTYVLLVWLAFGLAAFLYANDWHPSGWSALRQEAIVKPQRRDAEYYTGSIIIVPMGGEKCWQRIIDNRTGKMWEASSDGVLEPNRLEKLLDVLHPANQRAATVTTNPRAIPISMPTPCGAAR